MVRAVVQRNLYIDHGIARHNAGLQGTLNTSVHRRDEFLRNAAANDCIDEFIALAGFVRLQNDLNVTILTGTAALTLVLGILIHLLRTVSL